MSLSLSGIIHRQWQLFSGMHLQLCNFEFVQQNDKEFNGLFAYTHQFISVFIIIVPITAQNI